MLRGDLCLGLKGIVDEEGDGENGTVLCTWNSGPTISFSQSLFARTLPHVLDTYHIPAKVLRPICCGSLGKRRVGLHGFYHMFTFSSIPYSSMGKTVEKYLF